MKDKIHLIMPMGGAGSRFFNDGFVMPKPLIKINEKPFFYWATKSISKFVEVKDITFVVLQEHVNEFKIDEEIKEYFPDAKIIIIPKLLNGAVLTCLEGVKNITDNSPIIFNDCDHAFLASKFYQFCDNAKFDEYDGALLTFLSDDPKYSFLKLDQEGNVCETVEKKAVSNHAICGAYYFKNKNIFIDNANDYLKTCKYTEYFVSGVYNNMIKNKLIIKNFVVDTHLPFGTPEEYKNAKSSNLFKELL